MISARRFAAAAAFLSLAAPALAIVGPARDGDGYANRIVMVLARHGARQSVCSGVALAPRLVLTAAHCLESVANTLVAIRRDGRTAPVTRATPPTRRATAASPSTSACWKRRRRSTASSSPRSPPRGPPLARRSRSPASA